MLSKLTGILSVFLISVLIFAMPVHAEQPAKLNIVLVLDVSSSMKNTTKTYQVVTAVQEFVGAIPKNGSVLSIVAFTRSYDIIADNYLLDENYTDEDFAKVLKDLDEKIDYYKSTNGGNNGTAISSAMKQGDKLLSEYKDNSEYLTAMLVYTDGVDSRSAPADGQQVVDDFISGVYGAYPVYAVEMPTVAADVSDGEKKIELSGFGDIDGSGWIEELEVNNIPLRFFSIAKQLTEAILPGMAQIENPAGASDEPPAEVPPDTPDDAGPITGIEITNMPEEIMLENQELLVQGVLKTILGKNEVVVGDEEVYTYYDAKFYIKNETDTEYRLTDMEIQGGSYKTRYELPVGIYSFYIEVWKDDVMLCESGKANLEVLTSVAPIDIDIKVSPENNLYQSKAYDNEAVVSIEASLVPEDEYGYSYFYEVYPATVLVTRNNNLVDKIEMGVSGTLYLANYKIEQDGEYSFQVELLIDKTTGAKMQSVTKQIRYHKASPIFVLVLECLAIIGIIIVIIVKRNVLFPKVNVGSLEYEITDLSSELNASGVVWLRAYIGQVTLATVLEAEDIVRFRSDWLECVQISSVSKGISIKVKGNIEVHADGKALGRKKLVMQNQDRLVLIAGDYKAALRYSNL